jgi:tRNA dimethylallyltransferase
VTARPVIIAGPTASGKSALALSIAERDGGCVVNADASQVYGCWRILTARPDDADLARAPHRLYGHVACATRYSVGAWLRDVAPVIDELRSRGQRPIIVGGTGLYLSALTEGIAEIPETPPDLRARSEALIAAGRLHELLDDLARLDAESFARVDSDNPRRVQRAWEVAVATGRPLSAWHRDPARPILPARDAVCFIVKPDISITNKAIADRLDKMLELGALGECRRFLAEHDPDSPAGRVLGAAPLMAHLAGDLTLAAAVELSATATRQFAKRQRTWFRKRMAGWMRVDPASETALDAIPLE